MSVDVYAAQQEERLRAVAELAAFERLSRSQAQAHQLELLAAQLDHARRHSPWYREHWQEALGLSVQSAANLAKLPFTTKHDLRAGYPFGFVATGRDELIRYGESTGTTGDPTSSAITYADWIGGNVSVERSLRPFFGPPDVVFVAIPYELAFASYDVDRALESVGAAVVAVGTLSQVCPFERMVAMMRTVRPSGLVCTPTRALRLFDMLRAQGHDPLDVGLRTFLYIGETCSPAKLEKIAQLWQVRLTNAYGSTETNSLGLPCHLNRLHLTEDRHLFEVIDAQTTGPAAVTATGEQTGELVLTSLRARAMPLLRYRTGDLVTVDEQPCPCGSPRRTLRHHGRVSEQLVVAGRTVIRSALEQTILSTPGTELYYATGVRDGRLVVRVECRDDPASVCAHVAGGIAADFGIDADVTPVARATVMAAMDRMLKPGSLRLEDLEA